MTDRTSRPAKRQDIRIAVGYTLEAEPDEPLEPTRITVDVRAVDRDTGRPCRWARTETVADAQGEILVEIVGVTQLEELTQVQATARIEDGNERVESGIVPEDPKTARLESVVLDGRYVKNPHSRNGRYDLVVRIRLVEAAPRDVSGTITRIRPSGAPERFTIPSGKSTFKRTFRDVPLAEGDLAEIVVDLVENGQGTDGETWTAHREHNILLDVDLDLEEIREPSPGRPGRYGIRGRVTAQLAFGTASGSWEILGHAREGPLTFSREMGSTDYLTADGLALAAGETVTVRARVNDEESESAQVGTITVPDTHPNQIQGASLEPVPGADGGPPRLWVRFSARVPSGKGALVSASGGSGGSFLAPEFGTRKGEIDLGVVTEATTVTLTIPGGDPVTLTYDPPRATPVDESTEDEPTADDPTDTPPPDPNGETPPPDLVAGPPPGEDDPDDDLEEGVPATVEWLEESVLRPGFTGRVRVLDPGGRPCPAQWITWQLTPEETPSGRLHASGGPPDVAGGLTTAEGILDLVYRPTPETLAFSSRARFTETATFHHEGRELGACPFGIAPELTVSFRKEGFDETSLSVVLEPGDVLSGVTLELVPVVEIPVLARDGIPTTPRDVTHAAITPSGDAATDSNAPEVTVITIGPGGPVRRIPFRVHVDRYLYARLKRLVEAGQDLDESLARTGPLVGDAPGPTSAVTLADAASRYADDLVGALATVDPGRNPDALYWLGGHLGNRIAFLDYGLAIHQAFLASLKLHERAFQRTRDNMAHLTLEIFFFGPAYEAVKVAGKQGVNAGLETLGKQFKKHYADRVPQEFFSQAHRFLLDRKHTLEESMERLGQNLRQVRADLDGARAAQEALDTTRARLAEASSRAGLFEDRLEQARRQLDTLRQELVDFKLARETPPPPTASLREALDEGDELLRRIEDQKLLVEELQETAARETTERATLQTRVDAQARALDDRLAVHETPSVAGLGRRLENLEILRAQEAGKLAAASALAEQLEATAVTELGQDHIEDLLARALATTEPILDQALGEGVGQLADQELRRLARESAREHLGSLLASKYKTGELGEVLAQREAYVQDILAEPRPREKPSMMAQHEPHGWAETYRSIGDELKRIWDGIARELARLGIALATALGQKIRSLSEDMLGVARTRSLYMLIALLATALHQSILFLFDLLLLIARGATVVTFEAGSELSHWLRGTERARLISDLQTVAGCSNLFFARDARAYLGHRVIHEMREFFVTDVASGTDDPRAAVQEFGARDEAFETFARSQLADGERVCRTLAFKALEPAPSPDDPPAAVPSAVDFEALLELSREIRNYERDFLDPSGGREFWARYEHALNQARPWGLAEGSFTAANLDQLIDWNAWLFAMLCRAVGALALVSSPVTGLAGLGVGGLLLVGAEVADILGALLKTIVAGLFTETATRDYQEAVLILLMRQFHELFDR